MIFLEGLPFPPTMNHRYIPHSGRLILSPAYRAYKKLLSLYLHKKYMTVNAEDLKGKKLSVVICYRGPKSAWFTKDGSIKKIDVDNRHKTLFDVIFPFLDIDDSQVFEMKIDKVCDFSDEITVSMAIDECKN